MTGKRINIVLDDESLRRLVQMGYGANGKRSEGIRQAIEEKYLKWVEKRKTPTQLRRGRPQKVVYNFPQKEATIKIPNK